MKKILLFGILGALGCALGAIAGEPAYQALLVWVKQFNPKVETLVQPQTKAVEKPAPGEVAAAPTPVAPAEAHTPVAPRPVTPAMPKEVEDRLTVAHARTGQVQVTLKWDNFNDLDLHVLEPGGEEISFSNKTSAKGGVLDIDRNVGNYTNTPIEHVDYTSPPPNGRYRVKVVYYNTHTEYPVDTNFTVYVKQTELGELKEYHGHFAPNTSHETTLNVCDFEVRPPEVEPTIALTAPSEVKVPAKGENTFSVNLAKSENVGPVTIRLLGAGGAVTMEPITLSSGVKRGAGTLKAVATARKGPVSATLEATGSAGVKQARFTVPITVEVLRAGTALRLALPETVQVYPNGTNNFEIKVGRFNYEETQLTLRVVGGLGGGVTSQADLAMDLPPSPPVSKVEQLSLPVTVKATASARPGTRQVRIEAAIDSDEVHEKTEGFVTVEILSPPAPPPLWAGASVTAAWTALLAVGLCLFLTMGQNPALGKPLFLPGQVLRLLPGSVFAGAISGGGGAALSDLIKRSPEGAVAIPVWAGQFAGLGLLGALLGYVIAGYVPNLPRIRAGLAGAVGGFIGGAVFLYLTQSGAGAQGAGDPMQPRLITAAVLGFAIGCMVAIIIVTQRVSEAYLEVSYRPGAVENLNLGEAPVTVGPSTSCTARAKDATTTLSYVFQNGAVVCTETPPGRVIPTTLDATRQIGNLAVTLRGAVTNAAAGRPAARPTVAAPEPAVVPPPVSGRATGFSLRLSNNRIIALRDGQELTAKELPGLKPQAGAVVARAAMTPEDPAMVTLQNLSSSTWAVSHSGSVVGQLGAGQKLKLVKGFQFDLGQTKATVQ